MGGLLQALSGSRRAVLVVLRVAAVIVAALLADHALLRFWHQIAPIYRSHALGSRSDFSWFFYGMQAALRPGAASHLYNVGAQDLWMRSHGFSYDHLDMFGYPPPFALIFAPLGALPYAAARTLWTQINLVALGVGIGVAAWHAGPPRSIARRLLLVAGALVFQPLYANFYWGQPNALVLALLALGLWGIFRERPQRWAAVLGGVALGLGTVLKLTPAVVLAYLPLRWLLDRQGSRGQAALLGAVGGWVTVAVASAAAGAVMGWSVLWTYVAQAVPAVERSAWGHGPAPWNQSFRGLLMIWHRSAPWLGHASDAFAVGVYLLALLAVVLRRRLDPRLEAALAGLLVLLCSPSLEDHHFTVALLPWVLLGGYLLEQAGRWQGLRSAALLPVAAAWLVGFVALVNPAQLHWPPTLPVRSVSIAVPAGTYDRVYLLGAASYGPVQFHLGLRYRGAPSGSLAADWPDWWSPGKPLPPALRGEAVSGGQVHNASVGLYAFAYPVATRGELVALQLPRTMPSSNSSSAALHIVAVTLRRPNGSLVQVHLHYNTRGIAPSAAANAAKTLSFDGAGNLFFSPAWPGGTLETVVSGASVSFALPSPTAAANTLSVPPPASAVVVARPGRLHTLLTRAPYLVGISLLFLAAWLAGVLGPEPREGPEPEAGPA